MSEQIKVCVVGLGYIGLPTAALLASHGYQVHGVDISQHAVDTINQGKIHIVEPDLEAFVRSGVTAGRLTAHTQPAPADVFMLCVPTPFHNGEGDPKPNIDYVLAATQAIAPFVRPGNLVILESTSPMGTTQRVAEELLRANPDVGTFYAAYCPERVLPGRIMAELVENDRIVGGVSEEATRLVADFYREFVKGEVLETDSVTAEMCKLTENCFRDVNIAFANELSLISAKAGIDVWELIRLANHHPRVNILTPGTGVGGHCIAVDPWFVVASDPENSRIIKTARQVNLTKTEWVIDQIRSASQEAEASLGRAPRIACLGLAFKPDIDDIRESPAVEVVHALQELGHDLLVVEPHLEHSEAFRLVELETALREADIVAVLVNHRAFQSIDGQLPAATRVLNFVTASGASQAS